MAESKNIGPELPPHLRSREEPAENTDDEGCAVPVVGPVLPPQFRKSRSSESEHTKDTVDQDDRRGAKNRKEVSPEIIGPTLPPHLRHLEAGPSQEGSGSDDSGSSSSSESDSDSEVIGPRIDLQGGDYDAAKEFAERQRRAQEKESQEPTRESWMTELPRDRTGVRISGTEARTFLKRGAEDTTLDDGWTDTPGQEKRPKEKNSERAQEEQIVRAQRKRDADIDASLAEYNAAKRSKPLIDMHQEAKSGKKHKKKDVKKNKKQREKDKKKKKQKKLKSSKKKKGNDREEAVPARKPFNWEEDMRVSMVDTSRAKSMLDRTLLQSRFASGKVQKYL